MPAACGTAFGYRLETMSCCGPHCSATASHFGQASAEADLKRYHTKGLDKRGRLLLEGLVRLGIEDASVLDIGGGIGTMTFELLKRGATSGVLADAAPAYLEAARAEATRTGVQHRIQFEEGNFVETSDNIAAADVVVLDRAVCCYPDWNTLLERAAVRCRRYLGLTYPWNRPDVRFMLGFENLLRRFSRDDFRAFVHAPAKMHEALQASGLELVSRAHTFFWHIDVYARRPLS